MKVAFLSLGLTAVSALAPSKQTTVSTESAMAKSVGASVAAVVMAGATAVAPAFAITSDIRNQLSYEQVKGTGLANRCNEVVGKDSITVPNSGYKLVDLCLEPKVWQVEEEVANKKGDVEKQFVNTKLMTRQTYTLDGISGKLEGGGSITFKEEDGIDYAPATVQLPGGERVPFLFTVKELVAKGNGGAFKPGYEFGGSFKVPSYRTGLFLDPKGRGMTTGYDQAQALPGTQTGVEGQAELDKETNKVFDVLDGTVEFAVSAVNKEEGEIGGVFVSSQPSDTDMGAKEPKKILSKGIFYGRVVKDD
mmetsp:Transcript_4283/g.6057  ORF Transcript_4283/g.6057 Transcript_4283/m.6057 type:complete len:306 (-) Transcript_4283:408-1325(-)|eukprot:CAMPEP_0197313696 /NCGR_PEP_ID=MMETSP0891-20130614/29508_1 /TAXON_ID=44058 ORGANISM="Aureoumbra lagunensis, Strain CCMP1510" /NCGR_SAMPLE_ID=MMETSP0891 /ASSEMBLY_ACC=CAM_ASM_000534 /LENGTH=305 /DNA_ID=CAMNT_0042801715 /DNA_START=45 /DNA_END=962 /DNA_ORIENTATION=-